MNKSNLPPEVRAYFVQWGRKGGKRGTREQKSKAGKAGIRAMHKKLAEKAGVFLPPPESAPNDRNTQATTSTPVTTSNNNPA